MCCTSSDDAADADDDAKEQDPDADHDQHDGDDPDHDCTVNDEDNEKRDPSRALRMTTTRPAAATATTTAPLNFYLENEFTGRWKQQQQ